MRKGLVTIEWLMVVLIFFIIGMLLGNRRGIQEAKNNQERKAEVGYYKR